MDITRVFTGAPPQGLGTDGPHGTDQIGWKWVEQACDGQSFVLSPGLLLDVKDDDPALSSPKIVEVQTADPSRLTLSLGYTDHGGRRGYPSRTDHRRHTNIPNVVYRSPVHGTSNSGRHRAKLFKSGKPRDRPRWPG